MEFQAVTVSVPAHRIADLLAYAAELARSVDESDDQAITAPKGFGADAVRQAYLGGESLRWRPFLEILARRPGEWVEWLSLCEQINFKPAQAAGMLGAAERRCHQLPPYERKRDRGRQYLRMPAPVAEIIRELAAQS